MPPAAGDVGICQLQDSLSQETTRGRVPFLGQSTSNTG